MMTTEKVDENVGVEEKGERGAKPITQKTVDQPKVEIRIGNLHQHSRHQARHADQTINRPKRNTNPPQSRPTHNSLAQRLIIRHKAQYGSCSSGLFPMDIPLWMTFQSGIMNQETKLIKIRSH
jgi:hypothetical protein